jgi:16S rRNA (guanine527-N7)-methyltransferase
MAVGAGSRELVHVVTAADFQAAFAVSRETVTRLETYASLLRTWQRAVNLVAPATLDELWQRHFGDSAQLLALAPPGAHWADLGSGAGFPGLVIAILLMEQGHGRVTLIESDARKCASLREVARQTGAPVEICTGRIENAATQAKVGPVEVVTARALAPLDKLLELAEPYFGPVTIGLFPKGRGVEGELAAARARWHFMADLVPSRTDAQGRVVVIRNLRGRQGETFR